MTFKQLLQKVSFDDLIPHISCLDPFGAKFIPSYKETYDILQHMEEQELHSRSYDRTRRMVYLWELLTKYTPSDERPYTHTIAILSTAPDWPLTGSERQSFEHIVAKFSEKTEIVSAVGTMADLGEEAELFILKSY